MQYELTNHCYVLPDLQKTHPIAHDRFKFVWYPERGMSQISQMSYLPYQQSIITENPWLIAMYPRERVRVWCPDRKSWQCPDVQTYGASVNHILMSVLGYRCTIPAMALDGGKELQAIVKQKESEY